MSSHKKYVGAAVMISIGMLVIAAVLAPAFGMMYGPDDRTLTQEEGETYSVTGPLTTNATTVDDVNGDVTIELEDTKADVTQTVTVSNDTSETVTINGEDINVTVNNIADSTTAEVHYVYPSDYGWQEGTSSIFFILPLLGILVILAAFAGWAMKTF